MNFYNPYLYAAPIESAGTSFLSRLSLSSIISGTSRTLNFVNQAIPVVKQVSPIMKNLKTMFNVMNEFNKPLISENIEEENSIQSKTNSEGPTFFI